MAADFKKLVHSYAWAKKRGITCNELMQPCYKQSKLRDITQVVNYYDREYMTLDEAMGQLAKI